MAAKQATGARGEQIAAQYLQRKGYQIITTNWHCTQGELDIVARRNDTLVFVEVKTCRAAQTADALMNITPRKRKRLIASAHHYVHAQGMENTPWRIDVIAVALPHSGQPVIEHLEDALDW